MANVIAGIDPSYQDNNAVALWDGTKYVGMESGSFHKVEDYLLSSKYKVVAIYLEDSRLDTHVHAAKYAAKNAGDKIGAAAQTGRRVGRLDAVCQRWTDWAAKNEIPVFLVRPSSRRKGVDLKLTATAFKLRTNYTAKTNEHERDAAMLVFQRKL